jgi:V-type H+-transporting ATPase subunit a
MEEGIGRSTHASTSAEHRDDASDGGRSTSGLINRDDDHHRGGHEEHGVGDIVIHQAIETIEFILGSISNTASYLRLWALSLAHSQLAAVFWERTLLPFVTETGTVAVIGTYVACAVFFAVTFVVLMLMDNLECFLHALRLHWVEFMNKFFKAEGMRFEPLNFEEIFEATKKQKIGDAQ